MSAMDNLIPVDRSVQELSESWGERTHARRTFGTPQRTAALAVLGILKRECGLPDCQQLAEDLADAWAGEGGWDTNQYTKGLGAMRGQVVVQAEPRRERE